MGGGQYLHQLLQEQVEAHVAAATEMSKRRFASVCMKTTGWCKVHNNPDECSRQYSEAKHQCKKVIFQSQQSTQPGQPSPPSYQIPAFGIHIQGTISVQFTLVNVDGFLLAASSVYQYKSLTDADIEVLSEEKYFEKFQKEEEEAPFGLTYYGIFVELIKQVFVRRESSDLSPFLPSSSMSTTSDSFVSPLTVVEIGIARAGHSSNILEGLQPEHVGRLLGVDPYLAMYDEHDIFAVK
jgi:hypothetical protein